MPNQPQNPFGDESITPLAPRSDESVPGVPQKEPPLPGVPEVDGPESAPVQSIQRQYQQTSYQPRAAAGVQHEPTRVKKRRFNWGGLFTTVFIVAFSVPALYFMLKLQREAAEEARELSFKPAKATHTLSVSHDWQDPGFSLRPGDQLVITAAGEYFNSSTGIITAEGVPGSEGQNKGSRAFDPIFPHGCLIARTRGKPTEVFYIGAAGILKTDSGGRLQVKVNDLDISGNRGELILEARTFYKDPPGGEKLRGIRDSAITPISR